MAVTNLHHLTGHDLYSLPGQIGNYKGVFQVGVDTARYSVPTITHWFYKKGG